MSYARAVLYELTSGTYDEVLSEVRSGLAPLFREQEGFESYRTIEGDGVVVSISTWASKENAEAATDKAAQWVSENIAERVSPRETVVGEVTEL